MKNNIFKFLFISVLAICVNSCIYDSKKTIKSLEDENLASKNIIQVLKHPLVFEDMGLKILSFTSEEIKTNVFNISITLEVNTDVEMYSKNHFFFIHAFDFDSEEFLNMDTRTIEINGNGDTLVFKRELESEIYDFREIRFGLVNKIKKERFFTRTITAASIKNKQFWKD